MAQWLNIPGCVYTPYIRFVNKGLAIPHFSVTDISRTCPEILKEYGFQGLVFDKDNTITAPYGKEIHPKLKEVFSQYRELFGDRMVIMSNSAGTLDDKKGDAEQIESDLGIKVIRHIWKKPAGIGPVNEYFSSVIGSEYNPSKLVMFGDRILTDIVFGNRYGMLTIHTAFLTEEGDCKAAAKIRKYEMPFVKKAIAEGWTAPFHDMNIDDICMENLLDINID